VVSLNIYNEKSPPERLLYIDEKCAMVAAEALADSALEWDKGEKGKLTATSENKSYVIEKFTPH